MLCQANIQSCLVIPYMYAFQKRTRKFTNTWVRQVNGLLCTSSELKALFRSMLKPELFLVASNRLFRRCEAAYQLVVPVIYFIDPFLFESKLKTLLYLFYRENSRCGLTFSPKALGLLDLLLTYLHARQKSEKKLVLSVLLLCLSTIDSC